MTAVSPYVANHFRKYLRYSGDLTVVHNGVPDFVFRMKSHGTSSKSSARTTFATVLEGWAGRKNGQNALAAFGLHLRKNPGNRLIMFGSGHEPDGPAERWANRHRLADGVTFAGPVPYRELLNRLSEAVDVLVHPALEEALPMAIAEAMALGIPTIGGINSGGVPYMIEHERTGLLVDVRQPQKIANAMSTLAESLALRASFGQRAREVASQKFSIKSILISTNLSMSAKSQWLIK